MSDNFAVSRRTAALGIAGSLAAMAQPAIAGTSPKAAFVNHAIEARSMQQDHRHIAQLLRTVSRSVEPKLRAQAFERCKEALCFHDASEVAQAASNAIATQTAAKGLYNKGDSAMVLTGVLVRELDAWPKKDPEWLKRFSDLEAAFTAHVVEQERNT